MDAQQFKKFIEENASKDVDNMVAWISKKLDQIKVISEDWLHSNKQHLIGSIYATIIYNEWNSSKKNDDLFKKTVFIDITIVKLQEINSMYGAPKWVSLMDEILDIKVNRFSPQKIYHTDCTICLEECIEQVVTKCGHVYHIKCLQEWLDVDNICPNCKQSQPWPEYVQTETDQPCIIYVGYDNFDGDGDHD